MPLFSPATWNMIRTQRARTFSQVGNVYVLNRLTGAYDTLLKAGLACQLNHISAAGAPSGDERSTLLTRRRLTWDGTYMMPEGSQVTIDGQNWRPIRGTFANYQDEYGVSVHRAADVIRQDT